MMTDATVLTEFSDRPTVLVVADSDAARERACRSAELTGCRVIDAVRLQGAAARIERQVAMDVLMLEVDGGPGAEFEEVLDLIEHRASQAARGSVVSAPFELLDIVAARTFHPLVQHLCGADETDRVGAIAIASARPRHWLHDSGKDQGLPRLQEVSQDVARIASVLAALADKEGRRERLAPHLPPGDAAPRPIDGPAVRAIIRARRLRDQYLGPELFADPAWDILLDLYAASLERQRVAVSSLCIAAAVPATTALRWIKTLTDLGLLVRSADPQDGRRVYIELAPRAAAGLEAYLQAAQRISPSVL